MTCVYQAECGGCPLRSMDEESYRRFKTEKFKRILEAGLSVQPKRIEEPVFIGDGTRRRAALTFLLQKGKLTLGFNMAESKNVVDCLNCPMLTARLNDVLPDLRVFLERLTRIVGSEKRKGGKIERFSIRSGDILLLDADNGIDIVLETKEQLTLDHRMEIFDYMNGHPDLIRFSYRQKVDQMPEPIVEKIKPVVKISGVDVFVAAGMFLQASDAGQEALTELVKGYVGESAGRVADLFCGIGTFSYALEPQAETIGAYDLSDGLLQGFETSVHRQMLHKISVYRRNLFKNPLEGNEINNFDTIVLDPPRAGASATVSALAEASSHNTIGKIVYVSCNPHSFVNDANVLTGGGYTLQSVTLVDQFVYSNHSEAVALFTK